MCRRLTLLTFFLIYSISFSQVNENGEIVFIDCEMIESHRERLSCLTKSMNELILENLNANFERMEISKGNPVSLSYDITIDSKGACKLKQIVAENPNVKSLVIQLADILAKVKPFVNLKNEPVDVSYGSERHFYINEEGRIDDEIRNGSKKNIEDANVPFAVIENVPVYPGCKGDDNATLKKCMSDKISAFVGQNFDMKMIESLNLPAKKYRISVQFKIDKEGKVVEVRSRAEYPEIEEEAIRVVQSLPQMKPGIQRGKEVGVLYALPIIFEVQEETKKAKRKQKNKRKRQG